MTAPFPYNARVGRIALSTTANQIHAHYVWLARWSDEIGTDADIDLKKLAQLGFIHCRLFAQLTATPSPELRAAVERKFSQEGLEWSTRAAMMSDLNALRTQAGLLHAYVRDNVPEAREAVRITYDENTNSGTEAVNTLGKPHPAATEVASLRALFE